MITADKQQKRKVIPKKVVEILAKNGNKVSEEQAKLILDLMCDFGKLWLIQVKNQGSITKEPRVKTPRRLFKQPII
ncbi:hypothetical protein [Pedobacter antarcticus]|uniref:hypothetical protein n=1 Tax=Pedobacter antarcticus TaxID=34086 RepID=UPI0029319169|nr:hypothetical protein [Pedobacter antarcticus]